ncbi:MAG: MotA/TolQ/ExbB proton channel family protein [Akkermansiaceae bacterium]
MFSELQSVLQQGGIILWSIMALGAYLYTTLAATWMGLKKVQFDPASKSVIEDRRVIVRNFATLELDRIAWVDRRLPVIAVLVAALPLAGLLGTVSGMLATFAGMASGSNTQAIDNISVGISEALITTQAGLIVAIPAAIFLALLKRESQSLHARLQQNLHRSLIDHGLQKIEK